MSHTILLVQPTRKLEARSYGDFESMNEALEGLCRIYEEQLKRENPHQQTITYDISQLFDYIDGLTDLSVLVYDKTQSGYSPYNKEWIKDKLYGMLRRQAGL